MKTPFLTKNDGMSMIEMLVVIGIISVFALVMITLQNNQMKSNNFLEFQLKRNQLQNTLIGQFLDDPRNCACLFAGAPAFAVNPAPPGHTLTGVSPTKIGQYKFTPSGTCAAATVPQPFITAAGLDGIKLKSVQLENIRNISGRYSGRFVVEIDSSKVVLGPDQLTFNIPVNVSVSPPASGQVNFLSCSTKSTSNNVTWLPSTPMILCNSPATCGSNVGVQSSAWTVVDLKPMGVAANAKTLILRVYAHEASLFIKKTNDSSPPNYTNQVMVAWNDYSGFAEVRIDLTGSNAVIAYASNLADPPSYSAMIQIVGFEE